MIRIFLGLVVLLISITNGAAQEFNFQVTVTAQNLAQADPKIFENLEREISNLFNNTQWSDDDFEDHEQIKGNLQLNITQENGPTSFDAELIVQMVRPVYKSSYETPTFRYLDRNVTFSYDGVRPLQKTEDNYIDNLSAILSFYAYYLLAVDYDTFSMMGGDNLYNKALEIYNNLPSSLQRGDSGWTTRDNKQQNRYFLIENAMSPRFRRVREASYTYHRLGIDKIYADPNAGRVTLLDAIKEVGRANQENNNTILPRLFSDTKRLEIVEIFKLGTPEEKTKVRAIMLSIDPTQSEAYRDLR